MWYHYCSRALTTSCCHAPPHTASKHIKKHMRSVTVVACSLASVYSSRNPYDLLKNYNENKMCFMIFCCILGNTFTPINTYNGSYAWTAPRNAYTSRFKFHDVRAAVLELWLVYSRHGSVNRHIIATIRCERSKNGGRCYVLMDLIVALASFSFMKAIMCEIS
jgi:hypothetical protein